MQSFDLNTASTFLPVMDDTENGTKQLISSILMYNSLLDEKSKPILVNFVLTTRLSDNAKLRLSKQYKSVEQLVDDMNNHLIAKKSFTSLQQQLMNATQNQKTIRDYGKEIEDLFVQLTIAQADGDPNKRKILQPLNEKTAITRFATGLKNKNLGTIISARTYNNLKDAIRDAEDEQAIMNASGSKSSDNKQVHHTNMTGTNWGVGRGGIQSGQNKQAPTSQRGGHNQATSHGPVSLRNSGPPRQFIQGQPSHHGHHQPSQRGNSHPSYHGQGQSSRGNYHGHGQSSQGSYHGHGQSSQGSYHGHGQSTWGKNHGQGQSSQGNYHGHGQSTRGNNHGHGQSTRGKHHGQGQSSQGNYHGHGQSTRGNNHGHGQSTRGNNHGHGQSTRGNNHGSNNYHGQNSSNHTGGHPAKSNAPSQVKVETKVHVITTTVTSNAKSNSGSQNNNKLPKTTSANPKYNNNQQKNNTTSKPTGNPKSNKK